MKTLPVGVVVAATFFGISASFSAAVEEHAEARTSVKEPCVTRRNPQRVGGRVWGSLTGLPLL